MGGSSILKPEIACRRSESRSTNSVSATSRTCATVGIRVRKSIHACRSQILQLLSPLPLRPSLATILANQTGYIPKLQVPISSVVGHREHESSSIQNIRDELLGSSVKIECVEHWEEELQHDFETGDGRARLRHNENKALGGSLWLRVYGDFRLNLYQSGRIDEWLRLGIDGVAGKGVPDGCNGFSLLSDLFRFVELHVALQHSRLAVRIFFALLVLL